MFLNMYRIRINDIEVKKKRHLNNFITFVMVTIHPFSSNRDPWLIK